MYEPSAEQHDGRVRYVQQGDADWWLLKPRLLLMSTLLLKPRLLVNPRMIEFFRAWQLKAIHNKRAMFRMPARWVANALTATWRMLRVRGRCLMNVNCSS